MCVQCVVLTCAVRTQQTEALAVLHTHMQAIDRIRRLPCRLLPHQRRDCAHEALCGRAAGERLAQVGDAHGGQLAGALLLDDALPLGRHTRILRIS